MQDISLGVALGSATQIAMFVVSTYLNPSQKWINLIFVLIFRFDFN